MPLKRKEALIPISREHHHGLLLCWKIRTGFRKNIDPQRIKNYSNWFYENHLSHHFEIEEKYIFNILEPNDQLVKKAYSQHKRLRKLFESNTDIANHLSLIEEELESHIRFEERVLFKSVEDLATDEQLNLISQHHVSEPFEDNLEDKFWE